MNFVTGAIMTSFMPDAVNTWLIATMMEMIKIVDSNSVMAKIKLLKIPLMDAAILPVATMANRKIPTIHTMVVSRRFTINPIIKTMNST